MADDNKGPGGEFPTIIGPDAEFDGNLKFAKGLRLMGKLKGTAKTEGRLHVAREARMEADVEAGAITIEGEVKGNLSVNDRIELKESARYEGDLTASKLVVDAGAIFSGHVSVGPDVSKPRPGGPPNIAIHRPGPGGPGPNQPGGPQNQPANKP
jgi:cytoskeletal protein CcmA (bactofilin family)